MRIRPYEERDLPELKAIHERVGYDFPFPENLENYCVVVDANDVPLMAAGYKLVPEVTLICAPGGALHPLMKLKGISLIHEELRANLTAKGFDEAFSFIPPQLSAYWRHLQRHFGWKPAWKAFVIKDWRR